MQRRLQDVRQQKSRGRLCDHRGRFRNAPRLADRRKGADRLRRQIWLQPVEAAGRCAKSPRSRRPRGSTASSATQPISNSCRAAADRRRGPRNPVGRAAPAFGPDPDRRPTRAFRLAWRPPMRRCCSKRAKAKRLRSRSSAFLAGLKPTDAQLQQFYAANRAATWSPNSALCALRGWICSRSPASPRPTRKSRLITTPTRRPTRPRTPADISQAVVPDQATANAIATRAKAGGDARRRGRPGGQCRRGHIADRSKPRGLCRRSRAPRRRRRCSAPAPGAVVGPIQSDFGWVVAKVDSVKTVGGKTLDQARADIAAKLTADKRKQAIEDIADKAQTAVDDGNNFSEAAAAAKLSVTTTPLITAAGTARADPTFNSPPSSRRRQGRVRNRPQRPAGNRRAARRGRLCHGLAGRSRARRPGPARQHSRPGRRRLGRVSKRLAAPKRSPRRSRPRSRAAVPIAQAVKASWRRAAPVRPLSARRIEIATAKAPVPPAMQSLFTVLQGKSKMITDPQGRGFFVIKVDKVTPGNALTSTEPDRPDAEGIAGCRRRITPANSWPRCART